MGSEWREKALSEIVTLIGGGTPKRSIPEYWNGNVRWLSVKDFNDGYRHVGSAEESITELGVKKSSTRILQTGQLIISARGTVGALAQLALPMAFNQSCYGIDAKPEYTINDFLYYMIKYSISNIKKLTHGAVFDTITRNTFDYIKVQLPPLSEQKTIAHILGSLDDKIELNRKMNSTLESMAQALFKSWFVDFDPIIDKALAVGNPLPEPLQKRAEIRKQLGDKRKSLPIDIEKHFPSSFVFSEEMGWIPEGWEETQLCSLLEVKYGKDHKKLKDGAIPVYGSGGLMRFAEQSLYQGESVLIPRKGTLSNILHLNEEFWTVDTMFYTIPKRQNVLKYMFYHMKGLDFTSMNVGSAVPSMTTKILNRLPVLVPPETLLRAYESIMTQNYNCKDANNEQSKTLVSLRDTLLPKLISGELRVPDAEKLVEDAL